MQQDKPMTRPLYVFDLDGTIALIDMRRPLVEAGPCPACGGLKQVPADNPKIGQAVRRSFNVECPVCKGTGKDKDFKPNWPAFFDACDTDVPAQSVIMTLLQLYTIGCEIEIWSGRSDEVRGKTLMWLHTYTRIDLAYLDNALRMRKAGDFTPDQILKRQWLESMPKDRRERLIAAFDDRQKVVDMWRENGVVCFQVAPGDF